jgi:hypothetical protein
VPFIHGSFSYPTVKGLLPDPFMRIFMENMHRTKHGCNSGEGLGHWVPPGWVGDVNHSQIVGGEGTWEHSPCYALICGQGSHVVISTYGTIPKSG